MAMKWGGRVAIERRKQREGGERFKEKRKLKGGNEKGGGQPPKRAGFEAATSI